MLQRSGAGNPGTIDQGAIATPGVEEAVPAIIKFNSAVRFAHHPVQDLNILRWVPADGHTPSAADVTTSNCQGMEQLLVALMVVEMSTS